MSFEDDLKAQYEEKRPTRDYPAKVNGTEYVLRFTRMDGDKWAAEADLHPPRPGVEIDKFGYNVRAMCQSVVKQTGVRIDGDTEIPVTPDQWTALWKSMPAPAAQELYDVIWELNYFGPHEHLDALKKELGVSEKN